MRICDLYDRKKPVISLEVFPPKKGTGLEGIVNTIAKLRDLQPDFVSVTYSAGGSGSTDKTLDLCAMIRNTYGMEALAHLTCLNSTREDVDHYVGRLKEAGIENIMALRGDLSDDLQEGWEQRAQYRYASDLISDLATRHPGFCIGGAAYPEGHLEADSLDASLLHMKEKVEAGAQFLVTQLFFDNSAYFRFLDKAHALGVSAPISAGIMPILSRSQIERMIFMCGVSLPAEIVKILYRYDSDDEGLMQAGIEYSARQIRELIEHGVDGVHIYTMNRPRIAAENMAAARAAL